MGRVVKGWDRHRTGTPARRHAWRYLSIINTSHREYKMKDIL